MTLNLKTANQSSCKTLWPMMLHHHTKFGYRRFSNWGDVIQMNIHWNFDLHHNRVIQSFHKTIQLMIMWHQTKFRCKRISSSDSILHSRILIVLFLTVTLISKTANQSLWETIWLIMMHHHAKFGSKRFSDLGNIIWTNIHWQFEILLWPWPWTQQSNFSIKHSGLW